MPMLTALQQEKKEKDVLVKSVAKLSSNPKEKEEINSGMKEMPLFQTERLSKEIADHLRKYWESWKPPPRITNRKIVDLDERAQVTEPRNRAESNKFKAQSEISGAIGGNKSRIQDIIEQIEQNGPRKGAKKGKKTISKTNRHRTIVNNGEDQPMAHADSIQQSSLVPESTMSFIHSRDPGYGIIKKPNSQFSRVTRSKGLQPDSQQCL